MSEKSEYIYAMAGVYDADETCGTKYTRSDLYQSALDENASLKDAVGLLLLDVKAMSDQYQYGVVPYTYDKVKALIEQLGKKEKL